MTMASALRKPPRYVVVSPVRDEAQYLRHTIGSMLQQTIRPAEWIVVNDGSSDGTAEIAARLASEVDWISAVHRPDRTESSRFRTSADRGARAREAKEIEAFYEGFERITATDWDFLVKLDGDVGFEPDYFEKCFAAFDADPKLGIAGGLICNLVNGELHLELVPGFHVRGATKIYRRDCWRDIGGVVRGAGWDTLDEVKANMLGWSTRSLSELRVVHYRLTGSANGAWRNAVKNGVWSYVSGYHPLYMAARCARRVAKKPYVVGAIAMLYGFVQGYIHDIQRVDDKRLIRYLREQQLRRLLCRASIWR